MIIKIIIIMLFSYLPIFLKQLLFLLLLLSRIFLQYFYSYQVIITIIVSILALCFINFLNLLISTLD